MSSALAGGSRPHSRPHLASYVYEPGGTVDAWRAIGDEPCVLHLKITGTIDYIGADGEVTGTVDAATQCEAYLDWCAQRGTQADQRILGGN
jgi:hypothetical protein